MKPKILISILFALSVLTTCSSGKNILFFFGITNYSHRMSVWPLVEKLAQNGHKITCFSSHPPKALQNPNVTEIVPKALQDFNERWKDGNLVTIRLKSEKGYQDLWESFPNFSIQAFELLLGDQEFVKWYNSAKYDFIFIDALGSEFAFGLAHKFKAQYAILSTTAPYMWQNDAIGAPLESSWLPDMQIHLPDGNDMTFLQRVQNTLAPIWWELQRRWDYYPRLEKLLTDTDNFGLADFPGLRAMEENVSLVLTNTYFVEEYGRSLPPLVVPIGGMHCNYYKKDTPKDIQAFMNDSGASGGFIFLSLGSAAKVSNMPKGMQRIFFNAIEKSKVKFILQWVEAIPDDMPKNVFPAAWLPQQNILAHPNIKGFMTHGGLLGIQEAICSGVPLIVLPVFGEQDYNGMRIEKRKLGIKLDLRKITQETLDSAIANILHDPTYKRNMVEASKLFMDRPSTPVDTALWWTEFVLRHGHVQSMKPLGIYQSWWKRRLLDVWLFIFSLLALVPLLACILIVCLRRRSRNCLKSNLGSQDKKGGVSRIRKAKAQ